MNKSNPLSQIIGNSPQMQRVVRKVEQIANSRTKTVLIRGEEGTGKKLIAQVIHQSSQRQGPLIELDCGTLPGELLEQELLGQDKGPRKQRKGLLALANGGTLFLEAIEDLPMNLQARLLSMIQGNREPQPRSRKKGPMDVCLIAATTTDLEKVVLQERFHYEFYHWLKQATITLPPLRERGPDLVLLAEHFIDRFNRAYDKQVEGLSAGAIELLRSYHWPGNVRELRNAIERGVLLTGNERLKPESLSIDRRHKERRLKERRISSWGHPLRQRHEPGMAAEEGTTTTIKMNGQGHIVIQMSTHGIDFDQVEKGFLEIALTMAQGNSRQACKLLGMSYDTFRYRAKKYDLL